MAISEEPRSRLLGCVRAYREDRGEKVGCDTTFQQIEDEACEVGDAVAQALMGERLASQALQASQEPLRMWACCPRCQRPAQQEPEPEPRRLDTRRGPVGWEESKHYCRHCRRSFFPSVARAGD